MAPGDDFDDFVASRGPDLRRIAFELTSDRRIAEELVQRTLARCLSRWRRIDEGQDAFEFARTVLVRHRLPRVGAREHQPPREPGELPGDSLDDAARDELVRGLPGLRGTERKVVVLRLLEGLTEVETADAVGCSVNAVRRYEAAAVTRVRDSEAGVGAGPPDRASRVRRRLRTRRRYQAGAVAAALALGGLTGVGLPRRAGSTGPVASGPAAAIATAATAPSTPIVALPPRSLLTASPAGRHLVRTRTTKSKTQLWLYDAITGKPVRALLPPDDATTTIGLSAIDPDRDDRVVFVRHVRIPVAATDATGIPPLEAWRLDELSISTGQQGVLTEPRIGDGPDHLFFSGQGHRLAIATGNEVEVLNTFDDGAFPVTVAGSPHTRAIGFLAQDGPLLFSELQSSALGSVGPNRQTVTTVDIAGVAPDGIAYDSVTANCNPTDDLWALPSGHLILRTRCGPARTDSRMDAGRGFWVIDTAGAHELATDTSPVNYRTSVSWDSFGAALFEEFTPLCNGSPVLDRVTVAGVRTRLSGSFVPQSCGF